MSDRTERIEADATSPRDAAPHESAPPDSETPKAPTAITPPRVLSRVDALYPPSERQQGLTGTVLLRVTVEVDGSVGDVQIEQSVSPALDDAAATAVRQWLFTPARQSGAPVAATILVPFPFTLPPSTEAEAAPESEPDSAHDAEPPVVEPEADANVVVEGERLRRATQRSASDYVVDRDVLEAAPHHEGVGVLRTAPGMYIARPEGAAVAHRYMLRGFDSEHGQDIEFRVAGLPINLPSHIHGQGYADLGFLVAETVDELRVTEGVHDPRQGDFAVAGSIDIKLGVVERGLKLKSSYGSFGTFRQLLLWAPESQLRDSFGAVSFQHTDGFGQNRRGQSASAIVQQGFGTDSWRTRFVGIFYGARSGLAGVLRKDDLDSGRVGFYDVYPFPTARAQNALAARALVGAFSDFRGDEGDTAEVSVWLGRDHFRLQENFTGFLQRSRTLADVAGRGDLIEQRNQTRSVGINGQYRSPPYPLAEWFEAFLEFGLSGRLDEIEQSQNLLDASVRLQTWDERVDASILGLDVGAFADLDLHITRALKLRLGMRADALAYEVNDRLGNFAPAVRPDDAFLVGFRRSAFGIAKGPRASADVLATDWLTIHSSYGEGYRSPQARTLEDGEQTPFTKVRSMDLGTRLHWHDHFEFSVAGYHTELSNDVAFEAEEGRLERIGRTRRLGAVVHAEARPTERIVAAASVTYVDAELLEPPPPTADEPDPPFQRGQNLPYVPPLVVRADLGAAQVLAENAGDQELIGRAGLGFSALSARPLPFGDFAAPLALLDLTAGLGWGRLELGLDVYNVLDSRYAAIEYSFVSDWNPDAPGSRLPARHISAGAPRTFLGTLELRL